MINSLNSDLGKVLRELLEMILALSNLVIVDVFRILIFRFSARKL
jgi:hypothetical protein